MEVMHERVAGLDVHKAKIVACVRIMSEGKVKRECRTFETSTTGLEALLDWLTASGCTHVAMEATGVYWKPVWNILSDGAFELIVANPTSSFFCLISDEPSSLVRLIHCNCLGFHERIGRVSNIVTKGRQFYVDILML